MLTQIYDATRPVRPQRVDPQTADEVLMVFKPILKANLVSFHI